MQLSLITLNTWKCDGEYPGRLGVIADELLSRKFDFFLGQEIFDSDSYSTERYLSERLNITSFYEKSRFKKRDVQNESTPSYSGLCAWSNHILTSYFKIELPTADDDGERISQVLNFEIDGMLLAVINTHLTHLKGESSLRTRQIDFTLNEVHRLNSPDGIILCGDFNAAKESDEIKNLISRQGFEDAFPDCPPTHIGNRCIDHIFYYPAHRFSKNKASLILDKKVGGVMPSDHFGICAELNIHKDEG